MSKNITIQEGGIAKQLTVDKLKTNLVGSGTCLWVPEDEVQLTTKTITKNGTYKASDDGYYGYSEVTVSGMGSVTGTDGDGDEATVTTGGDGELVQTKIPSSIRITTEPSKMSYTDGEAINTSGMVVKAYYATGGEWGTVPAEEITIDPTTASIAGADYEPDEASSDLTTGLNQPIPCGNGKKVMDRTYRSGSDYIYDKRTRDYQGATVTFVSSSNTSEVCCAASDTPSATLTFTIIKELTNQTSGDTETTTSTDTLALSSSFTYAGKTVYYTTWTQASSGFTTRELSPVATGNPANHWREIAWTMVYGDKIPGGTKQTIKVQWQRPGDYKTLETSFKIDIEQSFGGATGGGGQAGDVGAGRND